MIRPPPSTTPPRRSPGSRRRLLQGLGGALLAAAAPGLARSQADWPAGRQVLRIIVPAAAGGSLDLLTRPLAQGLGEVLGRTVIVENRGGAAGMLGADAVAKAPADGYTLLMGAVHHAIIPGVYRKVPYDSRTDLLPVAHIGTVPNLVIVNQDVPARTPQELVDWIRARPGQVNYGTGGAGGLHHLSTEVFQSRVQADMQAVHYRGSAPAVMDLVGGQIQLMFETMPSAAAQVRTGKARAIAVTSAQRSAAFPDVPTLAETVAPGFEAVTWYGVFAPAGLPADITARLHGALQQALQRPEVRAAWATAGAEVQPISQAEFQRFWLAEIERWGREAQERGIRVE